MRPFDLSLYLVTDRTLSKKFNLVEVVEAAAIGGVTMVQLREKDLSKEDIKELGGALLKILKPKNIPLIINDYPELAKEIGADGVHLGSKDVSPARAREMLGQEAIIGLSIESLAHYRETDLSSIDYLAASPVFPTTTKPDTGTPFYLEGLRELCRQSRLPVVAIGGIQKNNARAVLEMGAAGIAVVSAICASDAPESATRELKGIRRDSRSKLYRVLTIAGSDSGGGAGIQADLKTFQALGCYGMSVITALTAQNTREVKSIFPVTPKFVEDQLTAVLEDIGVDAVKIGMLFSKEVVEVVRDILVSFEVKNVVLDPVMIAKSGDKLLLPDAIQALRELLFPVATLITPNLPESAELTYTELTNEEGMSRAADILRRECRNVLIKGGHGTSTDLVSDLLFTEDGNYSWFRYPRIPTRNTHGTGCTYSAAIAAHLAKGMGVLESTQAARNYLQKAITQGALRAIGHGSGPVEHQCV